MAGAAANASGFRRDSRGISLLAECDSRLGEIVGGDFQRHFVAGDNADEMLAHFSGKVC